MILAFRIRGRFQRILFLLALLGMAAVRGADTDLPQAMTLPGIENAFQASPLVYSGGQPDGDAAFGALQRLGVRVVISVDGTRPDVDRAARFGLRYVHLPHGYDGIPAGTVAGLVKAVRTAGGPVFIHCHHGKHRGPAAVGVVCQATAGWSADRAESWMRRAGTAPDYTGLYHANATFRMPTDGELARLPDVLPSRVEVSGLVDGMIEAELRWDHLKAIRSAGWRAPSEQPDLVPAAEALLLVEAYREMSRGPDAKARGVEFLEALRTAEAGAASLHAALKEGDGSQLVEERYQAVGRNCTDCHRRFRN